MEAGAAGAHCKAWYNISDCGFAPKAACTPFGQLELLAQALTASTAALEEPERRVGWLSLRLLCAVALQC